MPGCNGTQQTLFPTMDTLINTWRCYMLSVQGLNLLSSPVDLKQCWPMVKVTINILGWSKLINNNHRLVNIGLGILWLITLHLAYIIIESCHVHPIGSELIRMPESILIMPWLMLISFAKTKLFKLVQSMQMDYKFSSVIDEHLQFVSDIHKSLLISVEV